MRNVLPRMSSGRKLQRLASHFRRQTVQHDGNCASTLAAQCSGNLVDLQFPQVEEWISGRNERLFVR
jgi:hypothetical protein